MSQHVVDYGIIGRALSGIVHDISPIYRDAYKLAYDNYIEESQFLIDDAYNKAYTKTTDKLLTVGRITLKFQKQITEEAEANGNRERQAVEEKIRHDADLAGQSAGKTALMKELNDTSTELRKSVDNVIESSQTRMTDVFNQLVNRLHSTSQEITTGGKLRKQKYLKKSKKRRRLRKSKKERKTRRH
jgi:hypothetical protein